MSTWGELAEILENPRVHTDKGYSRRGGGAEKEKGKERSASTGSYTQADKAILGSLKWWSYDKGYGFVTPDDGGDDIFFHKRVLSRPKGRRLEPGDKVEFNVVECPEGLEAGVVNVLKD